MIKRIVRKIKCVVKRVLHIDNYRKIETYRQWIQTVEPTLWHKGELSYSPLISIVIPVYNVADNMLRECIESVLAQTYKNYQLILVDDKSSWPNVREILQDYDNRERVNVIYRQENGNISEATNTGLEKAEGEYIAFMDCDDVLASQALYEVVYLLNQRPELDFLYSDEDKITEDCHVIKGETFDVEFKKRHTPFFKPDWSPDAFMCLNYTNHLSVYRTELVRKTGGLRTKYNGSQDYDFTLRFMENTDNTKVGHIDRILYHWRERKESVAYNPKAKSYAFDIAKDLKKEMIQRRGLNAEVEYVEDIYQYRLVYHCNQQEMVSIIIPSKDNFDVLKHCLDTIQEFTDYPYYEIIIVDNGSDQETQQKIKQYIGNIDSIKYIYHPMQFNFSAMCNIGEKHATGQYLLFLNDDIGICQKGWLNRLVGHASQAHIGAVGAKLLYPETSEIQHAGVLNLTCGPSHAFSHMDDRQSYCFCRNRLEYDWLAVTGACLMVSRQKYNEVFGFNEELPVAYNDVDLCFKLVEKGYYNVCRNDVILYHYESVSRGLDYQDDAKMLRLALEKRKLYSLHPQFDGKDPFYNSNLGGYNISFDIQLDDEQQYAIPNEKNNVEEFSIDFDMEKINFMVQVKGVRNVAQDMVYCWGWFYTGNLSVDGERTLFVILQNENGKQYKIVPNRYESDEAKRTYGGRKAYVGFEVLIDKNELDNVETGYQIGLMISGDERQPWFVQWTSEFIV